MSENKNGDWQLLDPDWRKNINPDIEIISPPFQDADWHNFVTDSEDHRSPDTDEIARQYIQQSVSSQGMYYCMRQLGLPILKALANVLSVESGREMPFPISNKE